MPVVDAGYARISEYDLPAGLSKAAPVLAMGAELKSSFCFQGSGKAYLLDLDGDLENPDVFRAYHDHLEHIFEKYGFSPDRIVVDMHPDYISTQTGERLAARFDVELDRVQHHHAHIAACMAEYGRPLQAPPLLGVALDGLGYGPDGSLWGGEFLMADYTRSTRLACLSPVPMPGGAQAVRQPWRNTLAHLHACGWQDVSERFAGLDIIRFLQSKPLSVLHTMLETGFNSPSASSAGRLFDAVAACLDIHRESIAFEGQAAIELERMAARDGNGLDSPYPYQIESMAHGLLQLNWPPMWVALLQDIENGRDTACIANRFHATLIAAIVDLAQQLCHQHGLRGVTLCGGAFNNRLLRERISHDIEAQGIQVLIAQRSPLGDGGLALGQAAVCAAKMLTEEACDG